MSMHSSFNTGRTHRQVWVPPNAHALARKASNRIQRGKDFLARVAKLGISIGQLLASDAKEVEKARADSGATLLKLAGVGRAPQRDWRYGW